MQANAYMNATWAVAVAKAGVEDGAGLIGGSCIVDPNGLIVAQARTLADEVVVADCDLDACRQGKEKMFDFAAHRRPQWYEPITGQVGAVPPGPHAATPVGPGAGRDAPAPFLQTIPPLGPARGINSRADSQDRPENRPAGAGRP